MLDFRQIFLTHAAQILYAIILSFYPSKEYVICIHNFPCIMYITYVFFKCEKNCFYSLSKLRAKIFCILWVKLQFCVAEINLLVPLINPVGKYDNCKWYNNIGKNCVHIIIAIYVKYH